MYKHALVALFVFAAVAAVRAEDIYDDEMSQLSILPDDDAEVAGLTPDTQVFSDFCIESRDEVKNFVKGLANGAASSVYGYLFSSTNDAGAAVLDAEKESVASGANSIENAPQDPASAQEQARTLLGLVANAVGVVRDAIVRTAKTHVQERIEYLKSLANPDTLREMVGDVCHSLTLDLRRKLDSKLTQTKNALKKSAAASPQIAEAVGKVRLENVGCVTVGRVAKVVKACDALRFADQALTQFMSS